MTVDPLERGLEIRRDMFGSARTNEDFAAASEFDRPLQDLATRYCFGEVWARPGLSRKIRSMLTVALLIGMNRQAPLRGHVAGALANGVTKEELSEIILHCAVYCGIPAAVEGSAVAAEVLEAAGLD